MILVIDTNVFLQQGGNLEEFGDYFPKGNDIPLFFVALDDDYEIEGEYEKFGALARKKDPESTAALLFERILNGSGLFTVRHHARLPKDISQVLRKYECTKPIEPQLFGVARNIEKAIVVVPNSTTKLSVARGYLRKGILRKLQQNGVGVEVRTLHELLRILRTTPMVGSPENMTALRAFLDQYRLGSLTSEEQFFLEFKEPKVPYLTKNLLRDTVTAVSGMLNSLKAPAGGWVFIGVDDKGNIRPFPPRYKKLTKPLSVSMLLSDIRAEIYQITPSPVHLVQVWHVPDQNTEKCVVVIHVQPGTQEYTYRDRVEIIERGRRRALYTKPNRMKWIRVAGPATIRDPEWEST